MPKRKNQPHDGRSGPLWDEISSAYELDEHELALLAEAVLTAELCAGLQEIIDDDGLMVEAASGGRKVNPAAIELRQQRIAFARLLVALRIPTADNDDDELTARTQRRGIRGVYGGAA